MNAFWLKKPLAELCAEEWDQLCDGCGKCCLEKFIDEDTDEIIYSRIACTLLDVCTGRCQDYNHRQQRVPDCIKLTPEHLKDTSWLPQTCAYRRLAEGLPLPEWHPLLTGSKTSVAEAGQSVAGKVLPPAPGADPLLNLIDWIS